MTELFSRQRQTPRNLTMLNETGPNIINLRRFGRPCILSTEIGLGPSAKLLPYPGIRARE
jgi:hypothetical protein